MNESLKKLLLKLGSDEKLFLKLIGKNTINEMYEFCLTIQKGDYSREEFEQVLIRLIRELVNWKKLSDEDLANVGGGFSLFSFISDVIGAVPDPITPFNTGKKLGSYFKSILDDPITPETKQE